MPRASGTARRSGRARLVALPGGQTTALRAGLPTPVSSFIGREAELDEVVSLLRAHRLVTLTGVGGSGKTRLALAVAVELAELFPGGLWLVELASIADPDAVPRAVAAAVEISERPDQPLTDTLENALRPRSGVLVLDSCEHLLDTCADLVDGLLRHCQDLRVLTTSRAPLGITGEVTWTVPPLQEAVRLFTERALAVRPSLALSEDTAPVVNRIAERLDRLPLVLELAAARVRVLSVQEIAERLDHALPLLIGERAAVARHQTLQATFDWSHALLSPAEQVLFRRLSVFRGGFTLAAAESVCAGQDLAVSDVLDLVARLVEKSLVIADPDNGGTRYRLLEVVRQYAAEQREHAAVQDAELPARHAQHFLALAEAAERGSNGPDQPMWFDRLAEEHDNLRAALTWLVERPGSGPEAARLAAALWPFWFARGFLGEAIGWLRRVTSETTPGGMRATAKALNGLVLVAAFYEDDELAVSAGERCLALYRALEDPDGTVTALVALCTAAIAGQRQDIPVPTLVAEARSLEPQLHDRRALAHILDVEGGLALQDGDPVEAISCWQEAVERHRQAGNVLGQAFSLSSLGLLAAQLGDVDRARTWLASSLQLSRALGYKLIIQYGLIGLGKLAADENRLVRAARLWGAADDMIAAHGTHLTRAGRAAIGYEGQLAATRDRLDPDAWHAAWTEGAHLGTDRAVTYALDEAEPTWSAEPHPGGLSDREVEVLRLVARGQTSAEVGRRLFLSPRTVDWHLSSIYTKLGVRSRTEAARFALDHGLA